MKTGPRSGWRSGPHVMDGPTALAGRKLRGGWLVSIAMRGQQRRRRLGGACARAAASAGRNALAVERESGQGSGRRSSAAQRRSRGDAAWRDGSCRWAVRCCAMEREKDLTAGADEDGGAARRQPGRLGSTEEGNSGGVDERRRLARGLG
jgi:hypothetical protein